MRVLVVEDDEVIAKSLNVALHEHRYTVDVASDGCIGWEYAMTYEYDIIILDVMLPKLNGIHFCHQLRSHGSTIPILLVTAHNDRAKLIEGLDAGADDYIIKPFDLKEVLARLRALLRRGFVALPPTLNWGFLTLDPNAYEVRWHKKLLKLTPKEYNLLALLLRNPQRIYSSSALIDHLWSVDTPPSEDTIRSHIKGLRNKLKAAKVTNDPVETVYGIGYRLRKLPEADSPVESDANLVQSPDVAQTSSQTESQESSNCRDEVSKDQSQATADRIMVGLAQVWQQSQGKLFTRMEHLEQAIVLAQQGLLNPTILQIAEESAHKLAGSLGMFGLDRGSELAKAIELWSIQESQNDDLSLESVVKQVQELRLQLEKMSAQAIGENLKVDQLQAGILQNEVTPPQDIQAFSRESSEISLGNPVDPRLDSRSVDVSLQVFRSERNTTTAKILMLDDEAVVEQLKQILQPWDFELIALPITADVMTALQIHQPDLLILEVAIGEVSGLALCQTLRNTAQWSGLPILMLTDRRDPELTHRVFAAGADDLVRKPVLGPELITRLINRLERSRLLRNLAEIDCLTQVSNYRTIIAQAETFLRIAHRHENSLCLAIVDLYQLREINEVYGYQCGDEVLKRCAKILKASFQPEDLIGRWSDEEFVIVLYATEISGVRQHLADIVNEFRQQIFVPVHGKPSTKSFTANLAIGVAEYEQGEILQSIYDRAKQSLVADLEFQQTPPMDWEA